MSNTNSKFRRSNRPISKSFLDSLDRNGLKLSEEIALAETQEDILELERKMYPSNYRPRNLTIVLNLIEKVFRNGNEQPSLSEGISKLKENLKESKEIK